METVKILEQIDIFKDLTEDEINLISSITKKKSIKKNTLIFSKGDDNSSMYIIKEGSVDVFIFTESGKELILSTLSSGQYFGELSLLDGAPISTNIMANTDCTLISIHKNDFFQIMERNPKIPFNVISRLCVKVRDLTDKVEDFALSDVYHRFSLLLSDLSEEQENGERIINRSLTHKHIALRIGSSREMVTRIIKDLESGGYISVESKIITIKKKLPSAW